jgi:hypothetical protein
VRARAFAVISLAAAASSTAARAELPANGEPIRTHDYSIDLTQTPVLASTRVTGLAGAFVAMGEGLDGTAQNPAAAAFRLPWSRDHFDYELGLGIVSSSSVRNSDLFNSGRRVRAQSENDRFVFVNVALALQFGRWGFAVSSDLQDYAVARSHAPQEAAADERLKAQFGVTHAVVAYAFHDNQVLVGVGQRSSALYVVNEAERENQETDLFSAFGVGYEAGVLIRPNDRPFRIGAAVRSSVTAEASPESRVRVIYADDPSHALFLPDRVTLPWNLGFGFALELGKRPLNPRFIDPHLELEELERFLDFRERERARRRERLLSRAPKAGPERDAAERAIDAELETEAALDALHLERAELELDRRLAARYLAFSRSHYLLTTSLEIMGPVDDAVGIEAFLERRVQRSGRSASLSPRLGFETEPVPNWLRFRVGTYLEPTRFDSNPDGSRLHATLGFDQRLFAWDAFGLASEGSIFRASGSLDVARSYFSWGAAIGLWH